MKQIAQQAIVNNNVVEVNYTSQVVKITLGQGSYLFELNNGQIAVYTEKGKTVYDNESDAIAATFGFTLDAKEPQQDKKPKGKKNSPPAETPNPKNEENDQEPE